jgi:glycogen operon protein
LRQFALFEAIAAVHPRVPWQAWPRVAGTGRRGNSDFAASTNTGSGSPSTCNGSRTANSTPQPARRRRAVLFGFFRDLAVGAAPDGAEVWANPSAFAAGWPSARSRPLLHGRPELEPAAA